MGNTQTRRLIQQHYNDGGCTAMVRGSVHPIKGSVLTVSKSEVCMSTSYAHRKRNEMETQQALRGQTLKEANHPVVRYSHQEKSGREARRCTTTPVDGQCLR